MISRISRTCQTTQSGCQWMSVNKSIIKSKLNSIGANSNPLTKLLSTKVTFVHWNLKVITFQGRRNRTWREGILPPTHISGEIEVKTSPSNGLELQLAPNTGFSNLPTALRFWDGMTLLNHDQSVKKMPPRCLETR